MKKVLVVDDDAAVIDFLRIKLSSRYEFLSTFDPKQVVEIVKKERPDVVLCDIDMPRMSGGDVAAALSADPLTSRVPLAYLTSLVSPSEARALDGILGGRPGVSKRAPVEQLYACIESLTSRKI